MQRYRNSRIKKDHQQALPSWDQRLLRDRGADAFYYMSNSQ
jgi:hypothetical protein